MTRSLDRFQLKRTTCGGMSDSKRKRSNEQRLKAVQEKRAQLEARSLSINVSSSVVSGQHIVFSSDSEESSADNTEHAQKLALFGSGENSESESEESEFIKLEPKFEGEHGGQLFQLQQRIGHDKRFRVNERFLEREEREEQEGQGEVEWDELTEQIQREKANALKIISSLFGGAASQPSDGGQRSVKAKAHSVLPLRYDPNTTAAAELELGHTADGQDEGETSSCEEEGGDLADGIATSPSPQPAPVSTERYYSINEDIKDLFSSSQEKFNFLVDVEDEHDEEEPVANELPPQPTRDSRSAPRWLKAVSNLSLSKSKDINGESIATEDQVEASAAKVGSDRTKLFFHSCTPSLRNRLDENEFYRSQPLSELEQKWPLRRTVMKQSFRKRRRDAIKLAKKKRKYLK